MVFALWGAARYPWLPHGISIVLDLEEGAEEVTKGEASEETGRRCSLTDEAWRRYTDDDPLVPGQTPSDQMDAGLLLAALFEDAAVDLEEIERRIRAMPKAEIHVHLEGATDAETVWRMAARNGVRLPASALDGWRDFYRFRDFDHFLEVYAAACGAMRTPEDWSLMAESFLAGQARQNVRHSEAFVSVSHQVGKVPHGELLHALREGAAAGRARHGVRVAFIADIARHLPGTRWDVLEFALAGKEQGVVIGLGLGGREVGHPPEGFADVYAEARRQGLRVVAHAGETAGAESVRGALDALKAERIGHGVRCLEDPVLVGRLHAERVPLEVCPTSNYCLGVVPPGRPHPIRLMMDAGLFCTLGSDDPPMFGTDLAGEYRLLLGQGFGWEELWRLNLATLEAAFLPAEEKEACRSEWLAFAASL
jgi:adenosine deaminase